MFVCLSICRGSDTWFFSKSSCVWLRLAYSRLTESRRYGRSSSKQSIFSRGRPKQSVSYLFSVLLFLFSLFFVVFCSFSVAFTKSVFKINETKNTKQNKKHCLGRPLIGDDKAHGTNAFLPPKYLPNNPQNAPQSLWNKAFYAQNLILVNLILVNLVVVLLVLGSAVVRFTWELVRTRPNRSPGAVLTPPGHRKRPQTTTTKTKKKPKK